jgi:hypothetical protein
MEVGRLNKRATILVLGADLVPSELGGVWLGIASKDAADIAAAPGVRSLARVDIRARYSDRLQQGRYLKHGDRLFYLTSVRDPIGTKAELRCSADEFVGEPALRRTPGCPDAPCRIQLNYEAPYLDPDGQATSYRIRGEVVLIETGRVQVDDQFIVGAEIYNVIAYDESSDDGVVRAVWLERL